MNDVRAELLDGLNPEQTQVVEHDKGPLLVAAVAGSGKSTAVTRRVAYLVRVRGVEANRIFCTTFSKKGAGVMTERVRALLPNSTAQIQTFHAFCRRVLAEDMPGFRGWSDPSKGDSAYKIIVKKAIGYEHMKWYDADATVVSSYIELAKANGFHPNTQEAFDLAASVKMFQASKLAEAYETAEDLRQTAYVMTFSDWLVATRDVLRDDEQARRKWAGKFDYVMVDEMQDNSRVQAELVEMLSRDHRNIVAVGDAAQSLYSFRGAAPELFVAFSKDWSAPLVSMSRNYRSGLEVIDIANCALGGMSPESRCGDLMIAERGTHAVTKSFRVNNFDEEADEVASRVMALTASGVPLSDIAVLYRTNARSRAVEESFTREKIPYRVVGAQFFYARREISILLAYLRVAWRKGATIEHVAKTVHSPNRFLGKRFVEEFDKVARTSPGTFEEMADRAVDGLRASRGDKRGNAAAWGALIDKLREDVALNQPPRIMLDRILRSTDFLAWLRKDDGSESPENDRTANVGELLRRSDSFNTVGDLLAHVKVQEEAFKAGKDREDADAKAVTLSSIHSAKGLEWPHVFLIACNEKILPHAKASNIDEERRIYYVAVTRARDSLTISWVAETAVSRFVSNEFLTQGMDYEEADEFYECEGSLMDPDDDEETMLQARRKHTSEHLPAFLSAKVIPFRRGG